MVRMRTAPCCSPAGYVAHVTLALVTACDAMISHEEVVSLEDLLPVIDSTVLTSDITWILHHKLRRPSILFPCRAHKALDERALSSNVTKIRLNNETI